MRNLLLSCANPVCHAGAGCANPEPHEDQWSFAEDLGWITDDGILACSPECHAAAQAVDPRPRVKLLYGDGTVELIPVNGHEPSHSADDPFAILARAITQLEDMAASMERLAQAVRASSDSIERYATYLRESAREQVAS